MKLTILNRILLLNNLPTKGNFTQLIVIKDIIEKIKITQEEIEKYSIKSTEEGKLTWKASEDSDKEVKFTELEKKEIKSFLEEASKKNELTIDMLDLCKMFKITN